jgi:methionine synthase II (cobalamin-independent)
MKLPKKLGISAVGSFPHKDGEAISKMLFAGLDIPVWPQLPKRDFRESMYVQYGAVLPCIVEDEERSKIYFDVTGDRLIELEEFYERYEADDVDYFGLKQEYAQGFFDFVEQLKDYQGEWVKGQVTGPVSFGLTVTDQDLRASLYNEILADVIVKNLVMNARWQVRELKKHGHEVLIFIDEPYMSAFGSSFISLEQEQVVSLLNEVIRAIHAEGGYAGVHCCGNTDWVLLLETEIDMINFDAFNYFENFALFAAQVKSFIERDGVIAWGIVPNDDHIKGLKAAELVARFNKGVEMLAEKASESGTGLSIEQIETHSILTPACGLGSASMELTEQALALLQATGQELAVIS